MLSKSDRLKQISFSQARQLLGSDPRRFRGIVREPLTISWARTSGSGRLSDSARLSSLSKPRRGWLRRSSLQIQNSECPLFSSRQSLRNVTWLILARRTRFTRRVKFQTNNMSCYLMNQTSSSRKRPAIRSASPSTETLPRTRLRIKNSTPAARTPYATKLVQSNHIVGQFNAGHLPRATKKLRRQSD